MVEQTKAQKKRAEARERRRGQATEGESRENQDDGALDGNEEQPLDAVKQAAKVAVAGAAVGAAAAAARALTSRDDEDNETEPTPELEARAEAEEDQEPASEDKPAEQEPQDDMQEPQDDMQEPEAQAAPPREQPRDEPRHGAAPGDAKATVEHAREQLEALLDLSVESVSGFERTRDGWLVTLEVLELSRIPESTDVLASYEMELDDDRNLIRYTRGRRYHRSQADRGDHA